MRTWLLTCLAALALLPVPRTGAAEVGLIKISGAIGPATASYIGRAIDLSKKRNYAGLVIQLDTPGGLLESTKDIIQKFYSAEVPVIVYVAPPGATATSAGCFITIGAHIAAMAPNTSIGAAHPVSIGGGGAEKMDEVMKTKVENFASSYIQSVAEKRGRNAEWAIASVKESASVTAEKALELKVIDLIAPDLPALLREIDGRELDGKKLGTAGATIVNVPMLARERVFQVLWRPEVMLVLMLLAIYGIIGELSNPGAIFPGVVGAISLVLVLYMSAILPVNIAGLALIGLAIALFVIDLFAPSHGVLTTGGVVAFFLGALLLFNRADPAFRLSLAYIIPATVLTAAFFIFIVGAGIRAQFLPVQAGPETMVGKTVAALAPINPASGKVFVEGEYWNAVSDVEVPEGQTVEIVGINGLTLKVKPTQTNPTSS
jgi:membrane-bound serine protease (ClpP class)